MVLGGGGGGGLFVREFGCAMIRGGWRVQRCVLCELVRGGFLIVLGRFSESSLCAGGAGVCSHAGRGNFEMWLVASTKCSGRRTMYVEGFRVAVCCGGGGREVVREVV